MFQTNLDEGRPSRIVGLFESPAPPDGDKRPIGDSAYFKFLQKRRKNLEKLIRTQKTKLEIFDFIKISTQFNIKLSSADRRVGIHHKLHIFTKNL